MKGLAGSVTLDKITYRVASLVSDYGGQEQDNKVPHCGYCLRLEELETSTGNSLPHCNLVSAQRRRISARHAKPGIFLIKSFSQK